MNRLSNIANKLLFQLRWTFMSQERRYVYLWNRTESHYRYWR